ncbi:MAG TPA: T9SS type A sorting domain-containing protein [Aequorivita sp.]|nr:T9SS type A sorting domain-containing protein [Aequorivita sp.]
MKNVITFLMCTLCVFTTVAQSDLSGNPIAIPERTPALEALYQEAKYLDENGTAVQINANRLAIRAAWQVVDPAVAALYAPLVTEQSIFVGGNPGYIPTEIKERPEAPDAPEDWGVDLMIKEGFIDGISMDVTKADGHIYIGVYENLMDFGGTADSLHVYRSTNHGVSFDKFKGIEAVNPIRKIQLISLDGTGDNYLLAFLSFQNGQFQVVRWNMATGAQSLGTIASDVKDFSVSRNYPGATSSQRVFATYIKNDDGVYSARSTAGDYGFGWVDEANLGIVGEQISFTYGRDGGCFTVFVGKNSRSLRGKTNPDSNDPAAWEPHETLMEGSVTEVINPTIRAAKVAIPNEKVVVWASQRAAGTTDHFDGIGLMRESGSGYTKFSDFAAGAGGWSIVQTDGWLRRNNDVQEIQFSYVRYKLDGSENNSNRALTFNGTGFDPFEGVADSDVNVFAGFPSAIAETNDNEPCMAFAGTYEGFGRNLYFDRKSNMLDVADNSFENFKFYPNPTQDVLNLSSKNNIDNVAIFSLLGQKVLDVSVNQNTSSINLESLTQGVYVMKVTIDGTVASYKIIKQ